MDRRIDIEGLWPEAIAVYPDGIPGHQGITDTAGVRLQPTHMFTSSDFHNFVTRQVDATTKRPLWPPTYAPGFPLAKGVDEAEAGQPLGLPDRLLAGPGQARARRGRSGSGNAAPGAGPGAGKPASGHDPISPAQGRLAARLHLGRRECDPADRSRRPRHACQRHDRSAHQQRHRLGRRGVQREADAGEGHRHGVGRHLRLAELRHRRYGRARHPLRGGQRRQGHQHEHRPERPERAGRGGRDQVRGGEGRLHRDRRRQRVRGRQPDGGLCRDCESREGRRVGRRRRSAARASVLLEHGELDRARRAGWLVQKPWLRQ